MKLRIVSDGTVAGTRVETEDGQAVAGVQYISYNVGVDQIPEALIAISGISCELVADARLTSPLPDFAFDVQDEPMSRQELLDFIPRIPND